MPIDLNNIKTQIKSILDTANTTTASTDLSNSLVGDRVKKVFKFDMENIPVQADYYPLVTTFIDGKNIEPSTIAVNQSIGKRTAEVDVKVVGATFHSDFRSNVEDQASEDRNQLMENIEEILRANSTLNNTVLWNFPSDVVYESGILDEDTIVKVGVLNLRCKVHY